MAKRVKGPALLVRVLTEVGAGRIWEVYLVDKKLIVEGGAQAIKLSKAEDARFRKVGAQVTEAKLKELEGKGLPARAVHKTMTELSAKHAKSSRNFWN